ncbi:DNA-binding protein [Streptomyces avermitilis]|uniref:DNA-binding protein n=3 Tax=Streptomyces TaxID=1883 RepID=Q82EZ2_STRAW|nr:MULTISPECIES: helix-turn-helix transcriptional regulator [Streptomyces]KUN51735.1 DNA-binding protein [Streptomyces avermitilis]MYT00058.1 helix-turn-helix domain-containing protein [Streptomyces sp. SID5469]OOV31736.1 transcriptional regulator [Streptomyces avermitilis]BAC72183.1 putative DNA-binding protein [Streptomyces avermitilis MA-4680 = NBRC 14893]BBJ52490.1 transcriptional regulator [Streptomyces avermitilis]
MPARSIVTARQQRLGAELRKLRERAGLTAREAAQAAGIAESKISMTEAGRVGVSEERVRYLASQYACDDTEYVDALVAMANERVRGWWAECRGQLPPSFLDLAELEHHAARLRSFESVHIPGLLQTEEQVRAMYAASVSGFSEEQVDARTEFRLRRQGVLDKVRYEVVIHEAALRVRVADRKVARRQLLHIVEQSERAQVTLRVVPFDLDGFTRIGNAMLIAGGPVEQLDTVLLDSAHGGTFLDAEAQLSRYRRVIDDVERAALGVVESRDFVHRLAQHT